MPPAAPAPELKAAANAPLSAQLSAQLEREQVLLAIAQTQRVRLPHTLVDLAIAWVAWQAGAPIAALIYLPLMTLSHLGRSAWLARLLRQGCPTPQLRRTNQGLLAGLGLIKAALTLVVFLQPVSPWQELLTMILVGNAAGAVATAGGHRATYLSWALPFASGLVGGWLWRGGIEGAGIALLVLLLIAVLAGYVRDQGAAQRQLLLLNDSLRHERDRAERASESRTRFFAAASHDLRQPLTALAYNVATVEALAQLRDDDKLGLVASGLRRSLAEGQTLLNSLLEVSQLDAGAVELAQEPLDLAGLVQAVAAALAPLAEQAALVLRTEIGPGSWSVRADAALLRRVLQNLVGNAIKFTPPGGVVTLQLLREGDQAQLAVSDTGPGIAPELQERVFEEFFQVGNASRNRSQGLGLGLAIVRRLVDLMGLPLQLQSAPGQGCRFELRLPLLTPQTAEPEPHLAAVRAAPGQGLRLLLVDDEPTIREALSLLLSTLGWEVRNAADPVGALAQLQGWSPQALVLDFRLGDGSSGLDLLSQLRAAGCSAPAWLITGDTAPQRIQQAREAGLPVHYKPVDGLALAAEIRARIA